jgi:hypothetical protein
VITLPLRRFARLAGALAALLTGAPEGGSAQRLVVPRTVVMDELFAVRATGLRSGQRAIVRAATRDSTQRLWRAEAAFVADARGEVDVSRQAALAGSYSGVDPMGLVTSMDLSDRPGSAVYDE